MKAIINTEVAMLTLTSYFGFLLAALTITPALFIGLMFYSNSKGA